MPVKNLTDSFVKSAKAANGKLTEYSDTKERGLCLRVTTTGAKSWTFRYRLLSGEQKRLSIGKYPATSLSEARNLVVTHRANVAQGGDPALELKNKRTKAKEARHRETVEAIGDWYFQECEKGRHRPNAKRPKRQSTLTIEHGYFKIVVNGLHTDKISIDGLGKLNLATLPRATIEEFLNRLSDEMTESTSRHCQSILYSLFEFAIWKEITDRNPCRMLVKKTSKVRETVLSQEQLKTVWDGTALPLENPDLMLSPNVAIAIRLLLVTLQRRAEVAEMQFNEIDFEAKTWTIPGSRTKNYRTHVVPLSDLAIELIQEAMSVKSRDSRFLFPSPHGKDDKPINPQAITRAFGRLRKALGLTDIRPHDLRRTGSTNLTGERLGFTRFIVSKVLNHASDSGGAAKVTGIYDQNQYLPEKRRALDAWAIRLLEIVEEKEPADNIVTIVR